MAYLSYLGSNWVLVIICVLAVIVLGYLAFILKNWKIALAAIVLVCFGLAYQKANMDGYKRRVNEEAAAQVKLLNDRIATMTLVTALDAQRAKDDQEKISELERLASETPPNTGVCLDADATRRVRAIR
jgi:cell division protein FtsB